MMNALEAMNEVYGHLNEGDVASAQRAVCTIESNACVLPSSIFERVLRAAVEADSLLPFYREFCERAYGRATFASMLASMEAKRAA